MGTEIIGDVWDRFRGYISEKNRARVLCLVMQDVTRITDWDTQDEITDFWPESELALKYFRESKK